MEPTVDLRSDTVTKPTPEMREAMYRADVGDDVYGEDPTVNRLQELAAGMLGKEAALLVPTGTMGNLASLLAHCGRGDEVILGSESHTFIYEAGGISALGGIHPRPLRNQPDGTLALEDIRAAIRPDDPHQPPTRLVCLENTHNRCGGAVLTEEYARQVKALTAEHGLELHLDGARFFNASVALGIAPAVLAEPYDTITFCLSKALSAPVGSLICGSKPFIHKVLRARKILGGGMRQAGVFAAAGIVALEHMVDRLAEDHHRAALLARQLAGIPGLLVEPKAPPTNMVYVELAPDAPLSGVEVRKKLAEQGILIGQVKDRRFRMVTHVWIDDAGIERAVAAWKSILTRG